MDCHIRWMIRRDMPEVLDIERRSVEYPWSEKHFIRCLRQRNCIGMVADKYPSVYGGPSRVLGFMLYELHKDHLVLLNLAVHPEERRCGIGRAMVEKLIRKLSAQRRTCLEVWVRESNVDAQLFFHSCGLRVTAILRQPFDESDEDGYRFEYRLRRAAACAGQ